jgi:excinuclease ABC subunit A
MTIDDAVDFFTKQTNQNFSKTATSSRCRIGLCSIGTIFSTLSGGEAQRIKLASFLVKGSTKDKALFIFDEPTTGLHFHDIKKLITFDALIDKGHSILL